MVLGKTILEYKVTLLETMRKIRRYGGLRGGFYSFNTFYLIFKQNTITNYIFIE